MVDQEQAVVSSITTAGIVSLAHAGTHYYVEGMQSLSSPGVTAAGTAVFITTFAISYGGMMDLLPF